MWSPSSRRPSLVKGAVAGLVGGVVGTWVKSQAEPVLQDLGERWFPPTHAEKERPGADVQGHPDRMPPSKLAQEATDAVGVTLSRDEKLEAQNAIHWGFGASAGLAYGVLAEVTEVEAGAGVPAALALFAGTHGSTLPAVGLQASPGAMPAAWWVWELGSHVVYGVAVEVVRRGVRAALR